MARKFFLSGLNAGKGINKGVLNPQITQINTDYEKEF